jgi:hypothetical protein
LNKTLVQVEGTLLTDPIAYQSIEEVDEIYLARFAPVSAVLVDGQEAHELYLNFGGTRPALSEGDRITVSGTVEARQMVTRSGKMRRSGSYHLIVQDWKR